MIGSLKSIYEAIRAITLAPLRTAVTADRLSCYSYALVKEKYIRVMAALLINPQRSDKRIGLRKLLECIS